MFTFNLGGEAKREASYIEKKNILAARVFNLLDGEKYSLFGCGAGEVLRKLASSANPTDDPLLGCKGVRQYCASRRAKPIASAGHQTCIGFCASGGKVLKSIVCTWNSKKWHDRGSNTGLLRDRPVTSDIATRPQSTAY